MDHNTFSRFLTIVSSVIVVVLNALYYYHKRKGTMRWLALAYVMTGLLWITYTTAILVDSKDRINIMNSSAAPLIAYTLAIVAAGSLLRFLDLYQDMKLMERLNRLESEQYVNSVSDAEREHDV